MTFDSTALSRKLLAAAAAATVLTLGHAARAQTKAAEVHDDGTVGATPSTTTRAKAKVPAVDPPKAPGDPLAEKRDHWYAWIGVGYQGTVMPAFLFKPFVKGVPTEYFSTIKISADFRHNGFSVVPSLGLMEFGSGDLLVRQRLSNEDVNGNYSVVNSNLKMIQAQVDLLWSSKVHRMVDIEYGLGAGAGVTFGSLLLNWVYGDSNGKYKADNGRRFSTCQSATNPPGTSGCIPNDHSNSKTSHVGGYREPSWFNGGSKPSVLPIFTPEVGVRIKPHPNFMARVGIGWSLYGPWFGVSGFYGFEKPIKKPSTAPRRSKPGSEEEVIETSE